MQDRPLVFLGLRSVAPDVKICHTSSMLAAASLEASCSPTCVLCHAVLLATQGKQILQDGIGRATEIEEPLDPVAARQFLQQPSQLLKLQSELMQNLARWGVLWFI